VQIRYDGVTDRAFSVGRAYHGDKRRSEEVR
jgi:hypothetical protein